ncbi:hypothetical protein KAZ92_00895 [Candidatus Gracilibacteria bacterium]|nr:hypothetical protein [Candidatus Gracilibacteria bacterium]
MVPIEQLGEKNLLNVYYLASEIREKLEMSTDNTVIIPVTLFVSNSIRHYPTDGKSRLSTLSYMKEAGYILSKSGMDSKIYVDVPNQETIFTLCNRLTTIYHSRFVKPTEEKIKVNALTDEQVVELKSVLDTITFAMKNSPYYNENSMMFFSPLKIPYNHFPSSIKPFEINGLIYKLARDFRVIVIKNSPNWFVHNDPESITVAFPSSSCDEYKKLEENVTSRFLTLQNKKVEKKENQRETIQKVEIVNEQINVRVKPEGITSKVGRFPDKLKAGTQWKNIAIAFIDERNALLHIDKKQYPLSPELIGLVKGTKLSKPTATWNFLETLAKNNGELTPGDSDANPNFKKQKELLSKALQVYFSKEEDPFFPYESSPEKRNRSYKTRFAIFYQQEEKEDPFSDLGSVMKEDMPQI